MKTSRRGIMAIMRHEGVVQSRYKDAVGVWTIGVGHTAAAGAPDPQKVTRTLSMVEVMAILKTDLAKFEARVNDAVKVPLEQHEFDALVSFDFNTGGIYKATLTRLLNAGKRKEAAAAFMNWTKAGGKRLDALYKRRKEERAIFEMGAYPLAIANVYPSTSAGTVQWSKGKQINLHDIIDQEPTPVIAEPPAPKPEPVAVPPKTEKENTMSEKLQGVIRHVLTAVGGWAVGKGYFDEQTMLALVGAVTTLIGFVWSWKAPEKA